MAPYAEDKPQRYIFLPALANVVHAGWESKDGRYDWNQFDL